MPGEYREDYQPMFGWSFSNKKRMRLSASHAPFGLIDGLKNFHDKFNGWPKSLYDLFVISPGAQKAVVNMLGTNFSDVMITKSTPDTLEIGYTFHSHSKKEKKNSEAIVLNGRTSKRKYVVTYNRKDSSMFVDNIILK